MSGTGEIGRAFDAAPWRYDAARPGYPEEAVSWVLDGAAGTVVDLGAGTGILTAQLVARGLDVVAVDPSPAMLTVLRERLPGVCAVEGSAEATGLSSASADAVVTAAAFHWFRRPDADAEMARVLVPGGPAGLLWNPIDPDSALGGIIVRIRRRLGLVAAEYDPSVELDRRWFDASSYAEFGFTRTTTVTAFVEQLTSRSYLAGAKPDVRAAELDIARREALELATGETLLVPYLVTAVRATRYPP